MARPTKKKRICTLPRVREFIPGDNSTDMPEVLMPLEEYETVRLMDYNGLTQQECSQQMNVARTTVQALYSAARKRMAACLVEGRPLKIVGGEYALCKEEIPCCHAHRNNHQCPFMKKGSINMKLAVTYSNGQIFQHFGKTSEFKIYDIEDNKVVNSEVISTNGEGHGALAGILQNQHVDTLICGGIGGGAQNKLANIGIKLYGGVKGKADEAVEALLAGKLSYDPAVRCDHHGHGEHGGNGEGHGCGDHGCH